MALSDISAIHPPAVKVGGRRLSVTSRPKRNPSPEAAPVEPSTPADYPRPVHTGAEEQVQAPPPPHHEEEVPLKKEKKHENEKHLRDLAHRKLDPTRPGKEPGHKGFGAAGRIAQPAGRSLGV